MGGQTTLVPDATVDGLAARARPARRRPRPAPSAEEDLVAIHTDQVRVEDVREAGPVYVGHQTWRALTLDSILAYSAVCAGGVDTVPLPGALWIVTATNP